MARPKTLPGDEKYMLGESEHVNELQAYDVDELAKRLACDWHRVADHLGLNGDEKRAIEAGSAVDPVRPELRLVQVLRVWCAKPRSTVRILRQMLAELASDESVRQLDELRLMFVRLSLVLKRDGRRQGEVLSTRCPARKPLIDVVRPILHRKQDKRSLDRGDHVVVKLDITGASLDVSWSSPARCFVGQEWTITYTKLQLPSQSSQTVPRLRDLKDLNLFDSPQRNAITWMDDEAFIFGYVGDPAETAVGDGADRTLPGSSSFDDETNDGGSPIVYENSEDNGSSFATEAVNVEPSIFFIPPPRARHAEHVEVVELPRSGDEESDI